MTTAKAVHSAPGNSGNHQYYDHNKNGHFTRSVATF